MANSITYGLILNIFIMKIIDQLTEFYDKT